MKKATILNAFCLDCYWLWQVIGVNLSREEQCPECKSFNVKTFIKLNNPKTEDT